MKTVYSRQRKRCTIMIQNYDWWIQSYQPDSELWLEDSELTSIILNPWLSTMFPCTYIDLYRIVSTADIHYLRALYIVQPICMSHFHYVQNTVQHSSCTLPNWLGTTLVSIIGLSTIQSVHLTHKTPAQLAEFESANILAGDQRFVNKRLSN